MNRLQKCLLYTGLLFSFPPIVYSQACRTTPSAQIDFAVNAVTARLLTGGDLWFAERGLGHQVTSPENSPDAIPVRTLFVGGLQLTANDEQGRLLLRAQQYGRGATNFDYAPGPRLEDGTGDPNCGDWDRFFLITRGQIDTMLSLAQAGTPIDISEIPDNVLGWPATGNPYFLQINGFDLRDSPQGYAPFQDQNGDGIYDPTTGDYPLFLGDAATWLVFSSAETARESGSTSSLPLEIQLMVYGWKSESNVVNQTTFYQYRVISRAQDELYNFRAGHFIDSDLGCPSNEYLGSDPSRDLFFVYNDSAVEPEDCVSQVYISNLDNAPVSMFQLVDTPHRHTGSTDPIMESFSYVGAFRENPETAGFVSRGVWQDNVLLTRGGTGYNPGSDREPTMFMFDGGDVGGAPWRMCTEGLATVDLATRYTTLPQPLSPGSVTGFTLAQSTIFNVSYNEECPDLETIYEAADFLRQFYDSEKQAAGIISSTRLQQTSPSLRVFPNPAGDRVSFILTDGQIVSSVSLFTLSGRKILQQNPNADGFSLHLKRAHLPAGTYFYRLQTTSGERHIGKLILQ